MIIMTRHVSFCILLDTGMKRLIFLFLLNCIKFPSLLYKLIVMLKIFQFYLKSDN